MAEFDRITTWLNTFPILRLLEWDTYGDEMTELFKSYPNFTPASFCGMSDRRTTLMNSHLKGGVSST